MVFALRLRVIGSVLASFFMVLAGCGGGSDPLDLGSQSVVGTWRLKSVTVDDRTITCPGTGNNGGETVSCGEGTVRFGLDRSLEMVGDFYGGVLVRQTGSWGLNGSALTLTFTEAGEDTDNDGVVEANEMHPLPQPLVFNVGLSGDQLTLQGIGDNDSDLTFEKDDA